MAESTIKLLVDASGAVGPLKKVTKETEKLEGATRGLKGTKKSFIGIGQGAKAASVGVKGLGAAFSAALGPLTAVVGAAASLGQVFNVLRQQDFSEAKVRSLGVNSEELTARLKDVSTELSGQASVLDLTGAAYDVASAGFNNAADAALILKAASQGATGGFSDINTVGDATTSVLNAYGLEADKAAKLVDGFIQTQNDGKIVIGEYAANIAKVAPVAAALGVPLEEVNAAVAQITAGGQGAEVTFTALKTAFAQVAAGKVGNEFKALGIEINASTLKSDGLAGTLEKIKKSGADAGTVIKAFGTEAGPSILALLNDTEKYNQLLENQKEAQGAAAKAAFTASDTIDGQLKRLTTAFQNLFSDQSELGVVIKQTFKVAAVTVEALAAAINLTLAPIRAIFAAVNQVGIAISQALGVDGTNAAFQLEQGFQNIMKTVGQVQNFIIGFGVRIGQVIGKLYTFMINGGKDVASGLGGVFAGLFAKVTSFIQKAYSLIPGPIRQFLEDRVGQITSLGKTLAAGASSFFADTAALGAGFAPGAGLSPGVSPQDLGGAAANGIAATGGQLAKQKEAEQNKEVERLRKIAEQHEAAKIKLQEQTMLASAITDEEKKRFERVIQVEELLRNKKELSDDQLQTELNLTHELFKQQDQTENLIEADKNRADAIKKAADEQAAAAEKMDQLYSSIGQTITTGIVDSLTAAVDGTKSLAEVASDTLRSLANIMLKFGLNTFLSGLGGNDGVGSFSKLFGGGRASGGSVSSSKSYLVGERGPELFTPGRSGSIAPNGAMGGVNVGTINIQVENTGEQLNPAAQKQLAGQVQGIVLSTLANERRSGGML